MNKLVVCIMGQNCKKFIGMCLESVKDADAIVYCSGGSKFEKDREIIDGNFYNDNAIPIVLKSKAKIIQNKYNQEDIGMNGKQRNFYLNYLKENYEGWFALCLDADEVVSDLSKIKEVINSKDMLETFGVCSVKMRHFQQDLGHEDATQEEHYVLNRLFKINNVDKYPEVEHPVLQPKENFGHSTTNCTTIWHLAYIPNLWSIKKRYENHMKKSNMHTPEYLKSWYYGHLFGNYPSKPITFAIDVPGVILKEFGIDPDEIYFMTHKNLETKHFMMLKQWTDLFKPKNILDLGCGLGLFGHVANYLNIPYTGLELSEWAVKNTPIKNIKQGDMTEPQDFKDFDLVLASDVLEHLREEDLNKTLDIISKYGENFLFSIPFLGDPNLDQDPTHRIKKSKEWWINKLNSYFKIKEAPTEWLFHSQLLIGEKK